MIDLYIMENCPYCRKVMDFLDENHIDFNKNDISYPENHQRLLKLGGIDQVPFMVDGDIMMYESADIIEYLQTK